jgi:hypothetical protein
MRRLLLPLALAAALSAGCSGGGSTATGHKPSVVTTSAPDFAAFLRLPVATPSSCPSNVSGTTDGRTSVWAGRVDLSVFVSPSATGRQTAELGRLLRADPRVRTVYFESRKQAYEEFQRLYTCWAGVSRSQTPASYRVDLKPTVSIADRNSLVSTISRLPDVDYVACNPLIPCTSSLPTPTPTTTTTP